MSWFKRNWKKLLIGACGVAGAVAQVVPAMVPVAAACALAVPVAVSGGTVVDVVRAVLKLPVPPPAK